MSEFEGAQFVVLLCVESGCVDAYQSVWESGTPKGVEGEIRGSRREGDGRRRVQYGQFAS